MELLCVVSLISLLILVVWSRDIKIACRDGENQQCSYSERGRYILLNLYNWITNVEVDRLTDSTVYLPPHVKQLTI